VKSCLVLIPAPSGGHHPYELEAASSLAAAAAALRLHPKPVPDDAIITVILGGISPLLWNAPERNAKQPTYRHRAGRVREYAEPSA
jgi:hypothetical protein